MFRKATGPWSPWNMSGPVGTSLPVSPPGVTVLHSTFSWIVSPLNVTFTNLAFATFLPPSNLGAWKSMTNFCHTPGPLSANTFGAANV